MTEILFLMLTGILTGFIFKKKRNIVTAADKLAGWSIYLLLFLLGLSIGNNQMIITNFATIGLTSVILTLSGISGSVFFSFIIYKFLFQRNEDI